VTDLAASQVLFLHAQLCDRLHQTRGVRDVGALRRALDASPATSGDLFERAAALAAAFARYQPFAAANLPLAAAAAARGRLAAAAAGLLLHTYDLDLRLQTTDMPGLHVLLTGNARAALVAWLRDHTEPSAV